MATESKEEERIMGVSIKELLSELAGELDGILGLGVIDMDGVAIVTYVPLGSTMNVELTAAQLAMVMRLSKSTADKLRLGEFDENLLTTPSRYILTRPLGPDCYLAVILSRDAIIGMVRLVAQDYASRLYQALPIGR